MTEHIELKLYEHESKLVKVETILERVAINQDKMAEAVAQISNSILKQELILEKLSHLETNAKGSFERVHSRIDKVCAQVHETNVKVEHMECDIVDVKDITKVHDDSLESLEVFMMIKKYPIISALVALGAYSLTFEPIRNSVSSLLGLF